jgi:hypothetical protein
VKFVADTLTLQPFFGVTVLSIRMKSVMDMGAIDPAMLMVIEPKAIPDVTLAVVPEVVSDAELVLLIML